MAYFGLTENKTDCIYDEIMEPKYAEILMNDRAFIATQQNARRILNTTITSIQEVPIPMQPLPIVQCPCAIVAPPMPYCFPLPVIPELPNIQLCIPPPPENNIQNQFNLEQEQCCYLCNNTQTANQPVEKRKVEQPKCCPANSGKEYVSRSTCVYMNQIDDELETDVIMLEEPPMTALEQIKRRKEVENKNIENWSY